MAWTQERVQTLRERWAEGLSASQIAKQLGGVTRNACIGKIHRLGLPRRAERERPAKPQPRKVAPFLTRAPRLNPVKLPPLRPDLAAARTLPMSDTPLWEASPYACKFIAGDPAHDPRVCGRGVARDRVYCADHAALCYVAPDPKKKPRARA
jgi:GcrA cell cycle regulator